MFGYVYKTVNTVNGKIYIGKKHSITFYENYYGSGKLIKRALEKYGLENFKVEVIKWSKTLDELNYDEKYYIKYFDSNFKSGKGYNISDGGDGGNIISTLSKEDYDSFIKGCKIRNSGIKNPNYKNGEKIMGDLNPSKRPDVREKLKKTSSGKNNGMYGVRGENHPRYNTTHSEESRKKISDSLKKVTYLKVCKYCENQFESKHARTSYCTKDCKKRQYRDNKNR